MPPTSAVPLYTNAGPQQHLQTPSQHRSFRRRLTRGTRARFTAFRTRIYRRRGPQDQHIRTSQTNVRFLVPTRPTPPPNPDARLAAVDDESSRTTTPRAAIPRSSEPTPRRMAGYILDRTLLGSSLADVSDDRYVFEHSTLVRWCYLVPRTEDEVSQRYSRGHALTVGTDQIFQLLRRWNMYRVHKR